MSHLSTLRSYLLITSCIASAWLPNVIHAQQVINNVADTLVVSDSIEVPPSETDLKIQQRLRNIFAQIAPLKNVKVEVHSGVTKLVGTVDGAGAIEDALQLASQLEGVVYVVNHLDANVAVSARLNPAADKARELSTEALRMLPIIIIAILVVITFWLLGGWLSHRKAWLKYIGMDDLSAALLQRFIKLSAIGIGIFIALEILDATALAGAVLGVAGVAGLALGFAFRNIVENYLAGILLSLRNPFSTGDAVEIEGVKGKVVRLTSRDTVLMTFDGNHLRIPNSKIMTSTMTNFSRNPLRRFDFAIGVSVELDIVDVRKLAMDTLHSLDSVLDDPAPMIIIEELGDSTVNMRFYAWIDQRESDFLKSKSEAIRVVKDTFDDADIEMPEPIYRVHLKDAGGLFSEIPKVESNRKKRSITAKDHHLDTSADKSIDEQVKIAQLTEDEPNLLSEAPSSNL